ncbi:MAG: hypothetical protein IJ608_00565 [Lachnospiraceae bacterium]|nr:hypothetical protein [Lachnospiraceae bacterium]
MRKRIICVIIAVICTIGLASCGVPKTILDYGDAEAFEAALNNGENLEGKTVQFIAAELHPQSLYGYDIWAGEHLNFISSKNPDIKVGDAVTVKIDSVDSILGSWIISYEIIENAEIGSTTITSKSADSGLNGTDEENASKSETSGENVWTGASTEGDSAKTEESIEQYTDISEIIEFVDSNIYAFKGYFGEPTVSAYVAVKNISNTNIKFTMPRFDYEDNDGKLLAVDEYVQCIPEVIKPGQTGYIYSYYYDLSGIDLSNGLAFKPDAKVEEASRFYEIEVSDISVKKNEYGLDISVIGRGTNNTEKNIELATPSAVFYNSEDEVMGFCYGIESFSAGQTKSFEISGDLLTENMNTSDVATVKVYIQGDYFY